VSGDCDGGELLHFLHPRLSLFPMLKSVVGGASAKGTVRTDRLTDGSQGQRCSNRDCPCRLHNICTQHFFRSQPNNRRCPRCKAEWTGRDFVGEKAATGDVGAGRRTAAGPSRSATLTNGEANSGEDEDEDDE
jgi:RING-like domain